MLLVSGGMPRVSPPARGGTVWQERRVGGLGGLNPLPPTASGALREDQGLQDVREGDDPFDHIALVHHHQPVDLGRRGHREGLRGCGDPSTPLPTPRHPRTVTSASTRRLMMASSVSCL